MNSFVCFTFSGALLSNIFYTVSKKVATTIVSD